MKTTKSIIVVIFVLLTAQIASAYYCPSTGRWLSRDPIGEPGFQALQTAAQTSIRPTPFTSSERWISRDPVPSHEEKNIYAFVENKPVSFVDSLGLSGCKCGVKSLRAIDDGWNVQPTWIAFNFHVVAKLRTGFPYQASCCKVVQWRQDTTTLNGQLVSADGNQPSDGKLHIDSNPYIPGDDITNPGSQIGSLSGDTITYSDTPTRGGRPGDVLGGDLRFRIVVYDSCNNYKPVARTGFKVWWQGTWPKIDYGNN